MGCCVSKSAERENGPREPVKGKEHELQPVKGKDPEPVSVVSVVVEEKEPELNEAQRDEKLKKIFLQVDKDNSGFIDMAELKILLDKLKLRVDDENVLFMMARYDDDKNGKLNFEEFSEMVLSIMEVKKQFSTADRDNSGSISVAEMQALMASKKLDPETANGILRLFDEDSSGNIEYPEFVALVFYINELEYQYGQFPAREGEDSSWIIPMLGTDNAFKAAEVGKQLAPMKKQKSSFNDFARAIVNHAGGTNNDPMGRRKQAPLIKTQRARVRGPPKKIMKIQPSEFIKYVGNNGQPYNDVNFPPSVNVLPPKARPTVYEWRRPKEIHPDAKLFVNGVDEGDVIQGGLGDCWFLGALAVVATSTENFIEHLFVQKYPEIGYYQVRFFKNGKWEIVEVDDRLPVDKMGRLLFASCKDPTEFWVPIVEKAYAKLHGSYEAIESGSIADALKDLTGEGIEVMHLDNPIMLKDPILAWNALVHNCKESFLMGCAIDDPHLASETELACGLLSGHAYSIINCQEVEGHKLLRMRNPWGEGEWNGAWADYSKEWNQGILRQCDYNFANDGTFYMSFPDFHKYYSRVYVLRLLTDDTGEVWHKSNFQGEWKGETAPGCANNLNWLNNPQYSLSVHQPDTKLFINLSQPDLRYVLKKSPMLIEREYDAIGLYILKTTDTEYRKVVCPPEDRLTSSTFTTVRDLSFEYTLPVGNYVVIPSSFNPGIEMKYDFSLYSSKPTDMKTLTKTIPTQKIHSEWKGITAGGCINNQATWLNNPQFLLVCSTGGTVEVHLSQEVIPRRELEAVGVYVFSSHSKMRVNQQPNIVKKPSNIINLPTVTESIPVEANANYILMPTIFEADVERKFTISVSSTSATVATFVPLL